jgi:hypothetical protein
MDEDFDWDEEDYGDASYLAADNPTFYNDDDDWYDDDDIDFGDASYLAAPDRDIGSNLVGEVVTPSGITSNANVPISVGRGSASVITGQSPDSAINNIVNGKPTSSKSVAGQTALGLENKLTGVYDNPLDDFASYVPLWTMACLTPQQFNDPASYRSGKDALQNIVFANAGRYDGQRAKTYYGTPEYFIDNFVMKNIIASTPKTGTSNAAGFTFDVIEPYSMGLFLQSIQNAAYAAGYGLNYLDAVFVLKLDFLGFNEDMTIRESLKSKYFTMKMTKAQFSVTEGGSVYKCAAVPFNQQALGDNVTTLAKDMNFRAPKEGTVSELLSWGEESLCTLLNQFEEDLVKSKEKSTADVYEIHYPENAFDFKGSGGNTSGANRATVDYGGRPNERIIGSSGSAATLSADGFGSGPIAKASFGFTEKDGGTYPFIKDGDVTTENGAIIRDQMIIDPATRTFSFTQGQKITDIIVQAIVSSDYVKKALDPTNLTDEGYIQWFKIDAQIEILSPEATSGKYARKYIYRVVPYYVHHTVWSNPSVPGAGYDKLTEQIAKKYEYIYTGQNTSVLKFDIDINNMFFTAKSPTSADSNPAVTESDQNGVGQRDIEETSAGTPIVPEANATKTPNSTTDSDKVNNLNAPVKGGSGNRTPEQIIAENFHKAIIEGSSADMVKIKIDIMGDPYWIVDSGLGNYFSSAPPKSQITNDGTMNYEAGDVYIYIGFRTPADYNEETGLYDFSKYETESSFSGIYKVTRVENKFSGGTFKQQLQCIRMKKQPSDYTKPVKTNIAEAFPTKLTGSIKPEAKQTERPADKPATNKTAAEAALAGESAVSAISNLFSSGKSNFSSIVEGFSPVTNPTQSAIDQLFSGSSSALNDLSGLSSPVTNVNPNDIIPNSIQNDTDLLRALDTGSGTDTSSGIFGDDPGGA